MSSGGVLRPSAEVDRAFFGHPRGLYVCFATELWERFSFYGMQFLLLLYLSKYHLFSDANGLEALGSYTALFSDLLYVGLGVAALLLLISPILKRMMHEIH